MTCPKIDDIERCGAGLRGHCCIFITAGPGGITCARFDESLAAQLRARKHLMYAQWEPTRPFPDCQQENIDTRTH